MNINFVNFDFECFIYNFQNVCNTRKAFPSWQEENNKKIAYLKYSNEKGFCISKKQPQDLGIEQLIQLCELALKKIKESDLSVYNKAELKSRLNYVVEFYQKQDPKLSTHNLFQKIYNELNQEDWGNKEFVLQKLISQYFSPEQRALETPLKFAAEELREDPEIITEALVVDRVCSYYDKQFSFNFELIGKNLAKSDFLSHFLCSSETKVKLEDYFDKKESCTFIFENIIAYAVENDQPALVSKLISVIQSQGKLSNKSFDLLYTLLKKYHKSEILIGYIKTFDFEKFDVKHSFPSLIQIALDEKEFIAATNLIDRLFKHLKYVRQYEFCPTGYYEGITKPFMNREHFHVFIKYFLDQSEENQDLMGRLLVALSSLTEEEFISIIDSLPQELINQWRFTWEENEKLSTKTAQNDDLKKVWNWLDTWSVRPRE